MKSTYEFFIFGESEPKADDKFFDLNEYMVFG